MIPLSRPITTPAEAEAVAGVVLSGQLAQATEVAEFEAEFSRYLDQGAGQLHGIAVANGTLALQVALMALGVGPGDEVIVPAFTFIATANAVKATGAVPVFADVELDSFAIRPEEVERLVGPKTAAVIPVHLFGHPADMAGLRKAIVGSRAVLIEDAAQAHGAAIDGQRVGTFGIGCFSFYPTKNMTTGEGGMVTTADPDLAARLRRLRNHGMETRYQFEGFGLNFRMTEVAACLGRMQLRQLEDWNGERRANAAWLDEHLRGVVTPAVREGVTHVYNQYTIRCPNRDQVIDRLNKAGIGWGIYYPDPVHQTTPYMSEVALPVSEQLSREVLSIPVRPGLSPAELELIADAVSS